MTRLLAAVLVLGSIGFRLLVIGLSRFRGDELDHWLIARRVALGEEWPAFGPPLSDSDACLPGPLYYDLLALPQFFSRTPEASTAFIALLGGLSVAFFWDGLRRHFGAFGAFAAASLMAFMPWSVLFADRIWNPNAIGIFVAFAFWGACRMLERPNSRAVALVIVSSAAMLQIHMSSPMVWVALLAMLAPVLKQANRRYASIGLALGLALYVPTIVHEVQHGFANTRALLAPMSHEKTNGYAWVPLYSLRLVTLDVTYQLMEGHSTSLDELAAIRTALFGNHGGTLEWIRTAGVWLSVAVVLGFGVMGLIFGVRAKRIGPFARAALAGFLANLLLMAFTRKPIFGHYVQPLLPFYFCLFAFAGEKLRNTQLRASLFACLVGVLAIGGIDATMRVYKQTEGVYGLATMRGVLDVISRDMQLEGSTPIQLTLPSRASAAAYKELAMHRYGLDLTLNDRAKRKYYLARPEQRAPIGYRERLRTAYAVVFSLSRK